MMTERELAKKELKNQWKKLSGPELSKKLCEYFQQHITKDMKKKDPYEDVLSYFDGKVENLVPSKAPNSLF